MEISMAQIKELRERTGAGVMSCKKALSECEGDMEAATERLRKENLAQAAKRSGRSTTSVSPAPAEDAPSVQSGTEVSGSTTSCPLTSGARKLIVPKPQ